MGFYSDVQTIAKTKELTEKIDKAIAIAEEAKKDSIDVKRVAGVYEAAGALSVTAGANGSGVTQPGVDADGNPIDGPLAPPPTTNTPNPITQGAVEGAGGSGGSGGSSQNATPDNDKSGDAEDTNDDTRTDSANQADPGGAGGASGIDIEKIIEALEAAGSTEQEIANAVQSYVDSLVPSGVNEVSQVYNGEAGYTPEYGNWAENNPNSGEYIPTTSKKEQIKAVTGKDPENPSMTVRINLDGVTPKPSAAEAENANQLPWEDPNTPPTQQFWDGWEQGYYWSIDSGYGILKAPAVGLVARELPGVLDENEPTHAPHFLTGVVRVSDTLYTCEYDRAVGGPFTYSASRSGCVIGVDSPTFCPLAPAKENAWPTVGLWMMTLGSSALLPNPYDSEVPLKYKNTAGIGTVRLASGLTGDIYTVEMGANGGTLISNETNPDYFLFFGADRTLKTVAPMSYIKFYKPK